MKKILKVFRKVMFWVFVIFTILFIIAILSTEQNKAISIPMVLIFLLPWLIYVAIKFLIKYYAKKKAIIEEKRKLVEDLYLSKGFNLIVQHNENMLLVNEKDKLFTMGEDAYNFKDLISAEIVEDDDVITTTTTKNKASVGKALVGGALFGGVGAIIGGNAGKSKSTSRNTKVCDKLQVKLTLNSVVKPVAYLNLIKARTRKDMKRYKQSYEKAEHFLGAFQVIIYNK